MIWIIASFILSNILFCWYYKRDSLLSKVKGKACGDSYVGAFILGLIPIAGHLVMFSATCEVVNELRSIAEAKFKPGIKFTKNGEPRIWEVLEAADYKSTFNVILISNGKVIDMHYRDALSTFDVVKEEPKPLVAFPTINYDNKLTNRTDQAILRKEGNMNNYVGSKVLLESNGNFVYGIVVRQENNKFGLQLWFNGVNSNSISFTADAPFTVRDDSWKITEANWYGECPERVENKFSYKINAEALNNKLKGEVVENSEVKDLVKQAKDLIGEFKPSLTTIAIIFILDHILIDGALRKKLRSVVTNFLKIDDKKVE